jgi:hypothetical protein
MEMKLLSGRRRKEDEDEFRREGGMEKAHCPRKIINGVFWPIRPPAGGRKSGPIGAD